MLIRLKHDISVPLMVVVGSADALQVSRLMLDTPAHEGDERGPDQAREPLTAMSKVERNALRKNGCLDNYYPRGEGLATSPYHRARLRFHSPNFRV